MDIEFEKTLAMLSGQSAAEFDACQLTDADKQIIDNAIGVLYSGLSLLKWLDGGTLGAAWLAAMDALRDAIFSIPVNNMATNYVRYATFEHIRKMKIKMTSVAHTNEYINCPPEKRAAWTEDANTKIQNGMDIIRRKIMDWAPGTPQTPVSPSPAPQFREIFNSRTLERERQHEREREK
ncbi:MAG: hypothetical protein E7011_04060 [Alphaproteobacteria bacterium]|nr:hypothetical protein [Alphaproteobacteria bacterium]